MTFPIAANALLLHSSLLQKEAGKSHSMTSGQRISAIFLTYMPVFGSGLFVPTTVMAQIAAPNTAQIVRLTPEQKAELAAAGTEEKADMALAQARAGGDRQIHGSVGMMIGTGGARGIYGTAQVPLGENGEAVIAFENTRFGRPR
jgi:hypothetical protein